MKKKQQGFTLIELSIVLVIIGLIVGGVLVGKDLIRAAELRKLISQKEEFVTAAYTFKLKYNAWPGDMPNATNFWGIDPNGCPTPGSTAVTTANNVPKTETCNGNGDNRIFYDNIGGGGDIGSNERMRVWQHLANAELIAGQYTGTYTAAPDQYSGVGFVSGINAPSVALKSAYPDFRFANFTSSSTVYSTIKGHSIIFFHNTTGGTSYNEKIISSIDLHSIDSKYDDGLPGQGQIQPSGINSGSNCVSSSNPDTATYVFTAGDEKSCGLLFTDLF